MSGILFDRAGILHGVAYGIDRADVLRQAGIVSASYFGVYSSDIRIELENERIDDVEYSAGGKNVSVRFAADFRAEVIA